MWLNGRAFARDPKDRGFESRPVRFQVTALGKLLTRMCLLGGVVEQRVEHWTCDQQVVASNPTRGKAV